MQIDKYWEYLDVNSQKFSDKNTYRVFDFFIKKPIGWKILEIWPGAWDFSKSYFISRHWKTEKNLFFIDASETVCNHIQSIFPESSVYCWDILYILQNNLLNMVFDVIVLRHVFEHFDKNYAVEFMQKIWDHLSVGWQLLIEIPNWWNIINWVSTFAHDFTHMALYNTNSFHQMVQMYFPYKNSLTFFDYILFPKQENLIDWIKVLIQKMTHLFFETVSWILQRVVWMYPNVKTKLNLVCVLTKK